jgi:hypothetical protein
MDSTKRVGIQGFWANTMETLYHDMSRPARYATITTCIILGIAIPILGGFSALFAITSIHSSWSKRKVRHIPPDGALPSRIISAIKSLFSRIRGKEAVVLRCGPFASIRDGQRIPHQIIQDHDIKYLKIARTNCQSVLPQILKNNPELHYLEFFQCNDLRSLNLEHCPQIYSLLLSQCPSLLSLPTHTDNVSSLSLTQMDALLNLLPQGHFPKLLTLSVIETQSTSLPDLSSLNHLRNLTIERSKNISHLDYRKLPRDLSLLTINNCPSLMTEEASSELFQNLPKLTRLTLESLSANELPRMKALKKLHHLKIEDAPNLTEIDLLKLPEELKTIVIINCPMLNLPKIKGNFRLVESDDPTEKIYHYVKPGCVPPRRSFLKKAFWKKF